MSLAGARLLARWWPAKRRREPDQAALVWNGRKRGPILPPHQDGERESPLRPKAGGLSTDRVAQTVVARRLEGKVKAVEANTDLPWVVLYVTRWLQAPVQNPDGSMLERNRGTPQGSSVSPVLANLFLHYAFDAWLAREFPSVTFERYVDDAVVHCVSERQARTVLAFAD